MRCNLLIQTGARGKRQQKNNNKKTACNSEKKEKNVREAVKKINEN